MIGSEMLL